jgi:hypothetical protein
MVARGMMSGMMMPSALRRVCPCGESLSRAYKSAEVVDLASDDVDEDRGAYGRGCKHYRRCYSSKWCSTIDVVDGYAAGRRQRSSAVICVGTEPCGHGSMAGLVYDKNFDDDVR